MILEFKIDVDTYLKDWIERAQLSQELHRFLAIFKGYLDCGIYITYFIKIIY